MIYRFIICIISLRSFAMLKVATQSSLYEKVGNSNENCTTGPCPQDSLCLYNNFEGFFCQCKCGYADVIAEKENYKCIQRIPTETTITVEIEWVFPFRQQLLDISYNYFINELINEFLWRTMFYWDGHIQRSDYGTRYWYDHN